MSVPVANIITTLIEDIFTTREKIHWNQCLAFFEALNQCLAFIEALHQHPNFVPLPLYLFHSFTLDAPSLIPRPSYPPPVPLSSAPHPSAIPIPCHHPQPLPPSPSATLSLPPLGCLPLLARDCSNRPGPIGLAASLRPTAATSFTIPFMVSSTLLQITFHIFTCGECFWKFFDRRMFRACIFVASIPRDKARIKARVTWFKSYSLSAQPKNWITPIRISQHLTPSSAWIISDNHSILRVKIKKWALRYIWDSVIKIYN